MKIPLVNIRNGCKRIWKSRFGDVLKLLISAVLLTGLITATFGKIRLVKYHGKSHVLAFRLGPTVMIGDVTISYDPKTQSLFRATLVQHCNVGCWTIERDPNSSLPPISAVETAIYNYMVHDVPLPANNR